MNKKMGIFNKNIGRFNKIIIDIFNYSFFSKDY